MSEYADSLLAFKADIEHRGLIAGWKRIHLLCGLFTGTLETWLSIRHPFHFRVRMEKQDPILI